MKAGHQASEALRAARSKGAAHHTHPSQTLLLMAPTTTAANQDTHQDLPAPEEPKTQ